LSLLPLAGTIANLASLPRIFEMILLNTIYRACRNTTGTSGNSLPECRDPIYRVRGVGRGHRVR
jgi:hypothetical protein